MSLHDFQEKLRNEKAFLRYTELMLQRTTCHCAKCGTPAFWEFLDDGKGGDGTTRFHRFEELGPKRISILIEGYCDACLHLIELDERIAARVRPRLL